MLTILNLIDEAKCYEMVRNLRWPNRVHCAHCDHFQVKKRGFHNSSKHRQRYVFKACDQYHILRTSSTPVRLDAVSVFDGSQSIKQTNHC